MKFHVYGDKIVHEVFPIKPFTWPIEDHFQGFNECLLMGTNRRLLIRIQSHLSQNESVRPCVLGIDLQVPIENQLSSSTGNDRLAIALGAKQLFPNESSLVISAGTALVMDYINSKGVIEGGIITLGYERFKKAMLEISPILESSYEEHLSFPGKDTDASVSLGWNFLIRSSIQNILDKFQPNHLIITGGNHKKIRSIFSDAKHLPNLGADAMAKVMGYT